MKTIIRSNDPRFAVFILTHGRPDNCITYRTLKRKNFTGRIVLILDNKDKTIEKYKQNFPDCEIEVFDKDLWANQIDTADISGNHKAIIFARNASFEIAKRLGVQYFLQLDDDYTKFDYVSDQNDLIARNIIKNIEPIFDAFLKFFITSKVDTVCFAQGGDFIGGTSNKYAKKIMMTRKAMNSFFCRTENPINFVGLINEDVNTYTLEGSRGKIFFTSSLVQLTQQMTQQNNGGMTDFYLDHGTYRKSFYTIIYHPSSVTISSMGAINKRLHHKVDKDLTYPKILSEKVKNK